MHLGDKGTRGIEHTETASRGLLFHRFRDTVRREDKRRPVRHLREIINKDRSAAPQVFHHGPVMDNLMTHIDRAAVNEQRPLNNRDGPIDARAEPAGLGEIDFQRGSLGIRFGQAGLQAVSEKKAGRFPTQISATYV